MRLDSSSSQHYEVASFARGRDITNYLKRMYMDKELEQLIKCIEARNVLALLLSHGSVDDLAISLVENHIKDLDRELEEIRNGAKS